MSGLSRRQGVAINACLAVIHKAGHDPRAVQQQARNMIARGQGDEAAYSRAFKDFARNNPDVAMPLRRIAGLVEASNDATVEKYAAAVSSYMASGDETAVNALEPMMRADVVALAVRNGEVNAGDVAAGNVDWGQIGWAAPVAPATPEQFSFANKPAPEQTAQPAGSIRQQPADQWSNQVGATASPTGVRSGKAAERWERAERVAYGDAHALAAPRPEAD